MATTPPVPTSNPHQLGKSWVVLDDGDGSINITLPLGFGKQKSITSVLGGILTLPDLEMNMKYYTFNLRPLDRHNNVGLKTSRHAKSGQRS